MSFRIEYDDDQMSVLDKVNAELKKEKIPVQFELDDEEHDGFVVCTMTKTGDLPQCDCAGGGGQCKK